MENGEKIIGGGDPAKRKAHDFYPTPPEVTHALLELIQPILHPDSIIWEPACGDGDMQNAIAGRGFKVLGTDIQNGFDFLTMEPPFDYDWIITNPPFSSSEAFIRRAHRTGKPFCMLLKSQYWHSAKRFNLFTECVPDIVAPLTWRPDFLFKSEGKHGSPLMDVMWCVWLPSPRFFGETQYIPLERPVRT
jgi:hypothetical protein